MSNSSNSTKEYIDYLKYMTNVVVYYPMLLIISVGVIGNLFSIYIYSRPNLNKRTNTGVLYACFCFLNIVLILYFSFLFRPQYIFNYKIAEKIPCGMPNYFLRVIWSSITWILVFISFDRFIAVVFPLHKHIMRKKWIICLALLGIFLFVSVINISNLIQTPGNDTKQSDSSSNCEQSDEATLATSIISTTSRIYIPFAVMLTFNSIVIHRLRQSRIRVRGGITVSTVAVGGASTPATYLTQPGLLTSKEYKLFVSTVCIDVTFFVFNTPLATFITIWSILKIRGDLLDELFSAKIFLYYSAAQVLTLIYSVSSFFIFALFNRTFRHESAVVLGLRSNSTS